MLIVSVVDCGHFMAPPFTVVPAAPPASPPPLPPPVFHFFLLPFFALSPPSFSCISCRFSSSCEAMRISPDVRSCPPGGAAEVMDAVPVAEGVVPGAALAVPGMVPVAPVAVAAAYTAE